MVSNEEVTKVIEDAKDSMVDLLTREYKKNDFTEIAKKLAEGDLVEAYVEILNKEADFIGRGGKYNSDEYREIESMKHQCEHWIAWRVLKLSGWNETQVTRYYKK